MNVPVSVFRFPTQVIVANNYNMLVLGYRERYSIKALEKAQIRFQWNLRVAATCMGFVCYMAVLWKLCLCLACFVNVFYHCRILLPLLLNILKLCLEAVHFMLHVVLVFDCLQHMNRNNIANVLQVQILLSLCAMATLLS